MLGHRIQAQSFVQVQDLLASAVEQVARRVCNATTCCIGGTGAVGLNVFCCLLVYTSEIPSFLETQIIPSVRVYKRCCFR